MLKVHLPNELKWPHGFALLTGALLIPCVLSAADHPAGEVDFAREIMPILSDKCFACHGPDTQKKGALRLDSYAAATEDRGGYQAIDPVSPEKSEILSRLFDEDDPMPPADAEKQLTSAERELLARWVRGGGAYADHWAFIPPLKKNPEGIAAAASDGVIDAFVAAGLRRNNVDFAPEADRAALARRAALTLTGLPPEPGELERFLEDLRPGAYERFVDRLLANPRFGEHQARFWLDAIRYGDTHGLHLDNRRGIYPYRDWVVRSFNENLPLDDFIVWQLAGDLLEDPTMEQLIATGFVRMNPTTAEGGVLPEEFQAKNNFDRTETFGTVFLGMTLTCARCHTHKYDPIPQEEYYRLFAFFNSTAESPLDGNAYDYRPLLEVPKDQGAWMEWKELEAERQRMLKIASVLVPTPRNDEPWSTAHWRIGGPVGGHSTSPGTIGFEDITGLPGTIARHLPEEGDAVWVTFELETQADARLWLTYSSGPGSEVKLNGQTVRHNTTESAGDVNAGALLELRSGEATVELKLTGMAEPKPVSVWLEDTSPAGALSLRWYQGGADEKLSLLADENSPLSHLRIQQQAAALNARMTAARTNFTTTLIARDLEERRPTHILRRGEYNLPTGDALEPGIISVMGGLPAGSPTNRLGLAEWLVSRDHPLVARVLINRVWQNVFGVGLVRTPEDFGRQGQFPTHPELLDWLAVELQDSGWDLKHMIRLMVTSRTFRQSSALRDDVTDPENRLWSRGPGYRLDAEVLRDLGLWASGLLDPFMGGEGVKPYQPPGMWEAMAHPASNTKKYEPDKGRRLYRRSLYVYWKRTSPHPMMTLFDAPSRETSCVRRSRTNTSLQSLGLLNETQRMEMSRALAERLIVSSEDDDGRLDELFLLLASRAPTAPEREACRALLRSASERYALAEDDAKALLTIGEAERDESLNPVEHAAWTQLASVVLASDLAITLY